MKLTYDQVARVLGSDEVRIFRVARRLGFRPLYAPWTDAAQWVADHTMTLHPCDQAAWVTLLGAAVDGSRVQGVYGISYFDTASH